MVLLKIGIVLNSNEPETIWNTLRFAVTSIRAGHAVKVFLLGKGVEIEEINDEKFNVKKQVDKFLGAGGLMYACGTCLSMRDKDGITLCPVSTMTDMLKIVEESEKILVFS